MPPRPKPTALKIIEGNRGKRKIEPDSVQPEVRIPMPPRHLDDVAKREWKRVSIELFNLGILSNIDSSALAGYCQAYGRWVKAENRIKKEGMTVVTSNGNMIQSPLVGIANKAMQMMHKFLIEFGMTPSARTKVKASDRVKKDPLDDFLD